MQKGWIMSDEELLEWFCETRDQESFRALVQRVEPEVKAFLKRMTGDEHVADDLTQGRCSLLAVVQNTDKYEKGCKVVAWLIGIASNKAIDRNRALEATLRNEGKTHSIHGTERDFVIPDPRPVRESADPQVVGVMRSVVAGLPEAERGLVENVYFKGMTWNEAADAIGLNRGSATKTMAKAMRRLRQALMTRFETDAA